jgi:rRNA maturation protein Nop10
MAKIRYCPKCKEYTLKEVCERCNEPSIVRQPPKYSPVDKNAKYRREARKEDLQSRGLL